MYTPVSIPRSHDVMQLSFTVQVPVVLLLFIPASYCEYHHLPLHFQKYDQVYVL